MHKSHVLPFWFLLIVTDKNFSFSSCLHKERVGKEQGSGRHSLQFVLMSSVSSCVSAPHSESALGWCVRYSGRVSCVVLELWLVFSWQKGNFRNVCHTQVFLHLATWTVWLQKTCHDNCFLTQPSLPCHALCHTERREARSMDHRTRPCCSKLGFPFFSPSDAT